MKAVSPLVSVICMVYNHEKFLRGTLEGFVTQSTDFPFEVIIHDDASTDRSAAIIKEYKKKYPEIIKPIFQTSNQQTIERGRVTRICYSAGKGKYFAPCEGDDSWIDQLKLQKQVDFLEKNSDYVLCGTRTKRISSDGTKSENHGKIIGDVTLNQVLRQNQFGTCTVVFRAAALEMPPFPNFFNFFTADWPLWCSLLAKGKGYNFDFVSAHYNVHEGGATSGRNKTNTLKNKLEDRILMIDNFPKKKKIIKDYGKKIVFHFLWRSMLMQKDYYNAIIHNRKLTLKFLSY